MTDHRSHILGVDQPLDDATELVEDRMRRSGRLEGVSQSPEPISFLYRPWRRSIEED